MTNGFIAYWMYTAVKFVHFKCINGSQVNFLSRDIAEKNWENVNCKFKFAQIEKKINDKKELIYLNAFYYYNDPTYYVNTILEDKFDLYYKRKSELRDLERTFKNDINEMSEQGTLKELCFSETIPKIFFLDISPFSVCMLNMIFNMTDRLNKKNVNMLEKKEITLLKKKVDKFQEMFYYKIKKINAKKLLREEF